MRPARSSTPLALPLALAVLLGAAALIGAAAQPAAAQEACKMETLKDPKLSLAEAYAKAEKSARAWKADVVPAKLGNTSLGPLDAQGKSEAWSFNFYSASADAWVGITTFRGMYNCWANPGKAGRIPDLKPGFLVDGAKLYALAQQHGADLLAKGFHVEIQTAAAPETRFATWYINFSDKDSKDGGLSIIVDANTGKLKDVLRR
jgi:hypothetical protein